MKEFTIERAGFKFEFRATEEVNRDRRLRIGYKVANGPKHSNNTMPGTDGYFNAEYHDGIIYFWGLKLKGKKLDGLRLNDEALQKELDDMIDRAVAAEKAKEEAEIQALRDGTVKIELRYHDGEYLDGYQVYGHAADLLVSLGLAKWVDGWGYYVDHRAVETLGKEFTYQEAAEYARPALDAKNEELRKRAEKQAAREAERATMTVKIIEQGTTQGEEPDPYATVEITDPATGESARFTCRNIFDFGYVVNPAYAVAEGLEIGGLERDGYWQDFEAGKGWYNVRPLTSFETKAIQYLQKFPPISKGIRM